MLSGLSARSLRLIALTLLMLALHVAHAFAHAQLNATSPRDGAVVKDAPSILSLEFSEPVSPIALTLIRPNGASTALERFELKDRTVEIVAPDDLGRGTHVLTWRIVSADGHPVGGSVVFSIGEVSRVAPEVEEQVDRGVRFGLWLTKLALYVGLFLGAGGVFARAVLMPGVQAGYRPVAAATAVGVVGAVLSAGFQGLDALGVPASRITDIDVWFTGLATSYGNTVFLALIALVISFVGLTERGTVGRFAATVGLVLASLALMLSGHASAAAPQWLMRPAVFLHALCIAIWIGALVPLGLALRRREAAALPALARFSKAIPWVLGALVAGGSVLAVVQVQRPGALSDTAYGRVFLIKLALLAVLFTLAAINRWRLTGEVEAGDQPAARRLARSIAAETLIVLLVFGAASMWRFTPPPRALAAMAAQPATMHIHTEKAMADLTVTPGRAGEVDVSSFIMTGDFAPLEAKEVTFVFANPAAGIEPFERRAENAGDSTWRAEGVVLPLPGIWVVRIDILINDFELARIEGEIEIRR